MSTLNDRLTNAVTTTVAAADQQQMTKALAPPPGPTPTPPGQGPNPHDSAVMKGLLTAPADVPPNILGGNRVPYGTTGPLGDNGGYQYMRAAGYVQGAFRADQCKNEIMVSDGLHKAYRAVGVIDRRATLVPTNPRLVTTVDANGEDIAGGRDFVKSLCEMVDGPTDDSSPSRYHRKTLNTLAETDGGALIDGTPVGEVIGLQIKAEVFSRAGASQATLGPNGRYSIGKITGASSFYWVGEGQKLTPSQQRVGKLELEAKKLAGLVPMTRELTMFANPMNEALFRGDMSAQAALAIDRACLDGTGGVMPRGILNYEVNPVNPYAGWQQGQDYLLKYQAKANATNGDTFGPADQYGMQFVLPDMVQNKVSDNPAGLAYVMLNAQAKYLQTTRTDAVTANDGAGQFLFNYNRDPATGRITTLNGAKLLTSSNVPQNRVKGTGNTLSLVLYGYFPDWVIARLPVMEFRQFDGTGDAMLYDVEYLRLIQFVDAGARHASSFVVCDQLVTPT